MATRRTERVGNLIRNTLGELLLAKMSDPRFDSARTSITRVEVPEDLLSARVYITVAEPKHEQRTLAALRSAAGYLQDRMMQRIRLRNTPVLEFCIDEQFKKTMQTLTILSEVSQELEEKDRLRASSDQEDGSEETGGADDGPSEV